MLDRAVYYCIRDRFRSNHLPVPVVGLDEVGEGLGLLVRRVVAVAVVVV